MAESMKLWPSIFERIMGEWEDGYLITALRMSPHTQDRLKFELRASSVLVLRASTGIYRRVNTIDFIETTFGRHLIKVDKGMPDNAVIMQVDFKPNQKYLGPVEVTVEGR